MVLSKKNNNYPKGQMHGKKFVFVGNRSNVLKRMFKCGCDVSKVFVVKNSHLEKDMIQSGRDHIIIETKEDLIDQLMKLQFDVLVSNGCPYIIPISKFYDGQRIFVNIHPSLLPDLKGKHPINGALLFNRKHGVTCHIMDDGVDAGPIVSQIEIPITDDMNLDLLYFISFFLEGEVFEKALINNFRPLQTISLGYDPIYYSRRDEDMIIKRDDSIDEVLKKVRAFSTNGQYAKLRCGGRVYSIIKANIIDNPCVAKLFEGSLHDEVVAKYGGKYVLTNIHSVFIQFEITDSMDIRVGDFIS